MKISIIGIVPKGKGGTLLKSPQHMRVLEEPGRWGRSTLVGLQFLIFVPGEIFKIAIWPFFINIIESVYALVSNILFVLSAAWSSVSLGFGGYLEAAEDFEEIEMDVDSETD